MSEVVEMSKNIDEFLRKIENKYSTAGASPKNDLEEQLHILSQEFDTLGLPIIDITDSTTTLEQIMSNTFSLIHIHRQTLSGANDLDITCKFKDSKNLDLEKLIVNLKSKLRIAEDKNIQYNKNIIKLCDENVEFKKKVSLHNKETEKIKQYYKSKQNELNHHINRLENENHHLKEMCAKDVDKYFSKEDKFMKVLKKYKQNEDVHKSALQKLEENNAEIMNEILDLKRELALAYLKQ